MSNDTENYSASAASNTADWPEGMAPSAVNDAGRESQADIARWKDRIDGTATAAGTVDAITATFSPTLTALYDGRTIVLRAAGANVTTTPTFSPDGLTAKTIVRAGNQALVAGDIRGAGHFLILKYNTANDVWELMNPHYGGAATIAAGTAGPKIQTAALEQTATSEAVTQATIRDAAVGQAQLKTTTDQKSIAIGANTYGSVFPTGSTYTLSYYLGATAPYGNLGRICAHQNTYATEIRLYNGNAFLSNFYVYSRYVQASPPYNFGNGDVALFIILKINTVTMDILELEISPDPFWAYHGPHNLHPVDGKLQKAAGIWGQNITTLSSVEAVAALQQIKTIKEDPKLLSEALSVEFTMEEKMCDMATHPHSLSPLGENETYIMLDPCGAITDELAVLHEMGDPGIVGRLLESKQIIIGDPIDALCATGVTPVSASWKNTV